MRTIETAQTFLTASEVDQLVGDSGFAEAGADCRAFEAGGVDQGAIADGLVKGNGHLDAVVALAVLGLVARERFGVDPDDDVVDAE